MFKLKALANRPMVKSILALFTSSLFGRIMGTVYRVALVRAAGQDAVGLIQLALPVYRIARSLATMGLPVAIAKLTAERSELQRKPDLSVYRKAVSLMLRAALLAFAVQAVFSRFFAAVVLADARTETAIIILALLLIPIAFSSALRGAVQGLQRQDFMAGSDIAEVAVRIPVTLGLVALAVPHGPAYLAGAVAAGFLVGELACLFVLRIGLKKAVDGYARGRRHRPAMVCAPVRARALLALGVPVMLTGLLNNSMNLITVALIPRLLQETGMSIEEATRAYGRLSGMAVPTLYMPMMLVFPVTQTMLPELTRLVAQNAAHSIARLKKLLRKVYLGTLAVSATVAPLLWFRADWLGSILYGDASVGGLIRPLGMVAPFALLGAVSADVLCGLGRTAWVLTGSLAGNAVRILLVSMLAGNPAWGIVGVLWAVIADVFLTSVLQLAGVWWVLKRKIWR
ncbi:MAG: oligosaccharide flippase family protein [Firmicutes bacterium]|nr:oligosaccharide flippase family protein [Bacillota bacterium]